MHKVDEVIERLREDHADTDECEHGFLLHRDPCPNTVCLARDLRQAADLLASLKKALEPFANRASEVDADRELVGDDPIEDDTPILEATQYARELCVGDLRRARNALNGETNG